MPSIFGEFTPNLKWKRKTEKSTFWGVFLEVGLHTTLKLYCILRWNSFTVVFTRFTSCSKSLPLVVGHRTREMVLHLSLNQKLVVRDTGNKSLVYVLGGVYVREGENGGEGGRKRGGRGRREGERGEGDGEGRRGKEKEGREMERKMKGEKKRERERVIHTYYYTHSTLILYNVMYL